jgi:adenylate cyclase
MERRLAAVLAADIVGYSRLMENDELGVLARQAVQYEAHISPHIAEFNGRVVKTTGDGFLAEFPSVVDAVNCAVAFQGALETAEASRNGADRIRYRTGINIGDIILQGDDIFGDGVNVAARLEAIAPPGGLCISELVWQNLRGGLSDAFQDIGPQSFKNIDRRIRAWKWPPDEGAVTATPTGGPLAAPGIRLAVCDLKCGARDSGAADFAEGLVSDLIVTLGKLDTLDVVRAGADPRGGARYVLEGNVRTSGARVRCNMILREVETGASLWAERFDGSLEDVFPFQDEIIETVVSGIEIELSDGQQVRRWRHEAGDSHAYEAFLQGRAAYKEYSRPGIARARDLFLAALESAPGFHSAAVGLARTHIEDASFGWAEVKSESFFRAREILEAVLAIEPEHPAAHAEMAHLRMRSGDYQSGLLESELAVALDPNDAEAFAVLSFVLNCIGRHDDAIHNARRALSLNPGSPEFYIIPIADACIALGRHSEAAGLADQILARRPKWLMVHAIRALALDGAGRGEAAVRAVTAMRLLNPRFTISRWRGSLHNPELPHVAACVARLKTLGLPD